MDNIKVNELRIGNLLQDRAGIPCLVESVGQTMEESKIYRIKSCVTSLPVSPIPVTEEWLTKLGFERTDYPNFTRKVSALTMTCRIQIGINYSEFGGIYFGDKFKYVHQLQNFIFSVSGQELCVTQP